MTVKEIAQVLDESVSIVVNQGEETVAVFDVAYMDSIIDDILSIEIGSIDIKGGKGITLTVTDAAADEEPDDGGNDGDGGDDGDGDDGGNTEPDDEP